MTSAAPHKSSPQDISPSWPLSTMYSNNLMTFLKWDAQNFSRGCQGGTILVQSTERQSPPLTAWRCCAGCTPGQGWPFWLSGHTDSCRAHGLIFNLPLTQTLRSLCEPICMHSVLLNFYVDSLLTAVYYQWTSPISSCILAQVQNQNKKSKPKTERALSPENCLVFLGTVEKNCLLNLEFTLKH